MLTKIAYFGKSRNAIPSGFILGSSGWRNDDPFGGSCIVILPPRPTLFVGNENDFHIDVVKHNPREAKQKEHTRGRFQRAILDLFFSFFFDLAPC